MSDRNNLPTLNHCQLSFEALEAIRQNEFLADCTIVCDGKKFQAHRIILSASSPFFMAMFKNKMREALTGTVELNVPPDIMDLILKFVYSGTLGKIENNTETLKGLLHASHQLELSVLFNYCSTVLQNKLAYNYFYELWNIADLYSMSDMITAIQNFVVNNFSEVRTTRDFAQLTCERLRVLLQHPDMKKTDRIDADEIVKSILVWIRAEEEQRKPELMGLLNLVDQHKLSPTFLRTLLRRDSVVKSIVPIYVYVTKLLLQSLDRVSPSENKNHVVCFGNNSQAGDVSVFNLQTLEWSAVNSVPFPLTHGSACVVFKGCCYFFGGKNVGPEDQQLPGMHRATSVYRYFCVDNTSEQVEDLIVGVHQAGAVVLNNKIYVVGGIETVNNLTVSSTTVQKYDPDGYKSCEIVAPTRKTHNRPHLMSFSGYLYVVGSCLDGSVERYDDFTNQWTVLTTVPGEIGFWCSAAICGNELYVLRERTQKTFLCLDLVNQTWREREFVGGPDIVVEIKNYRNNMELLIRGEGNILYSYSPQSGNWIRLSTGNGNMWNVGHTLLV